MPEKMKNRDSDPAAILQAAIRELESFTEPEATRLEVGEDGRLVAAKETRLERVVGLARTFIVPIFSDQVRQERQQKLEALKQAVLHARDIIQSHSALIEKLKEGDPSQQKLADYALAAIQRYNSVVTHDPDSNDAKFDAYNFERDRLLLDEEIKGLKIELPYTFSVKFDSHPAHPAQERLKELRETFLTGGANKQRTAIQSIHKKTDQFMVDTFRMKAIRMIQTHLSQQSSIGEILSLVKETEIEVDEESNPEQIIMRQLLEVGPGSFILLTGCFNRKTSDSKFMKMPILDSFRLSSQLTHSGFPYPSQHNGWALSDKWIQPHPLRVDQTPNFQMIEQRRKQLAQRLLYDQPFIHKVRARSKLKREVFDQHHAIFLPLHRTLQERLIQGFNQECAPFTSILDAFYEEAAKASSPFKMIVQSQQQLAELFIKCPLKALEEEWLETDATPLRMGSPQEKFQVASLRLERGRKKSGSSLNPDNIRHAFILQQGSLLGTAFQAIGLQYQSEKMGFAPPLLSDFERKLQICAFQQLISFLEECECNLEKTDPEEMKDELLKMYSRDLDLIQSANFEEEDHLAVVLADELEVYFNSRYYAMYPRRMENIS